nr:hypothetical protein [Tanacetum cinerariifolium]
MLAICVADNPMVFKAPKTSLKAQSVSQGTKPGAKTRHKKPLTSSKQPYVFSKEATKGGSSKALTRRIAMDSDDDVLDVLSFGAKDIEGLKSSILGLNLEGG